MLQDHQLDALQDIDHCEQAVIHLLSPSTTLTEEKREGVALLFDHFRRRREQLLAEAARRDGS